MSDMDALVEVAHRAYGDAVFCSDEKAIYPREAMRSALLAAGLPALLERVEAGAAEHAEDSVICECRSCEHYELINKRAEVERLQKVNDDLWAERDALAAKVADIISGVRAWCAINEIADPPLDWVGLGEFLDRAENA